MPAEESGSPGDDRSGTGGDDRNVIPAERLHADLVRVIEELGRPPTTAEYDERGAYSFLTVANRLGAGAWYEAIRAVGHEPTTHVGSEVPAAKLRANLARVVDEVEGTPTMSQYDDLGEFTAGRPLQIGSDRARGPLRSRQSATPRLPARARFPDAAIREDLHRVAEAQDQPPTIEEYG